MADQDRTALAAIIDLCAAMEKAEQKNDCDTIIRVREEIKSAVDRAVDEGQFGRLIQEGVISNEDRLKIEEVAYWAIRVTPTKYHLDPPSVRSFLSLLPEVVGLGKARRSTPTKRKILFELIEKYRTDNVMTDAAIAKEHNKKAPHNRITARAVAIARYDLLKRPRLVTKATAKKPADTQ